MTHRRLREALGRVEGGAALAREVTRVYWAAAAQARPTELLADGITEIAAMTAPATLADARMPADLLALAYPLLQQARRGEEAKTLHETFQAALGTLAQSDLLQRTDTVAYLNSLAGPQPQVFLAGAQPLLAQAGDSKAAEDLRCLLGLARTTYAILMLQGRIDDAKTLHTQIQAAVTTAGDPEGLADADKLAYRNSLSQGAIDGMYALFKRAVAAGDVEGTRKWLTNLNDVAPEHPKAVEARRLFKKLQQPNEDVCNALDSEVTAR